MSRLMIYHSKRNDCQPGRELKGRVCLFLFDKNQQNSTWKVAELGN
jgi:hypothetical protein